MATLSLKRGAALLLDLLLQNDDGTPVVLAGLVLTAQLRDAQSGLVANLPITATGAPGLARIEVLATGGWPLGVLRCDIQVDNAGRRLISQTFSLRVERQVTGSDAQTAPDGGGLTPSPINPWLEGSVTLGWPGGAIVAPGTYLFAFTAPFGFRIDSLDWTVGSAPGTAFVANVQIVHAGVATSVTGLSAVVVNAAPKSRTPATAANTVLTGDGVQVVLSAVTGGPTDAALALNFTRT
jgi:hypothetical protein